MHYGNSLASTQKSSRNHTPRLDEAHQPNRPSVKKNDTIKKESFECFVPNFDEIDFGFLDKAPPMNKKEKSNKNIFP